MTASGRMNSHTDIKNIDETRGNITVEGGELLVNERNIDWQTHTHHRFLCHSGLDNGVLKRTGSNPSLYFFF